MIEKRQVLLKIKGDILEQEASDESIELKTQGTAFKENGQEGISYQETEIFGMEGTTTTILINKDSATIIRLGSINSELAFIPNERNVTLYATPYGEIQIGILTNKVTVSYNEDSWIKRVLIDYTIEIAHATPLHNIIDIQVFYENFE